MWRIISFHNIRCRYCCKDYERAKQKALSFKIRSMISMLRTPMLLSSLSTALPSCTISTTPNLNGERRCFRASQQKQEDYEGLLLMICMFKTININLLHLSIISLNSSKFMNPSPSRSPSRIISYSSSSVSFSPRLVSTSFSSQIAINPSPSLSNTLNDSISSSSVSVSFSFLLLQPIPRHQR